MSATARARPGDRPLTDPLPAQRRQVLAIGVLLVLVTVTTAAAAFSSPPADETAAAVVRGWDWLGALPDGRAPVLVVVLALAGAALVLLRGCRVLPAAAAAALAAGLLVSVLLRALVGWVVPVGPAGVPSTVPSADVLVLAVAGGLLVTASTGARLRRAPARLVAVAAAAVVALRGAQEVHDGTHRPLDVVVAVLLGGLVVLVARLVVERPSLHGRCRGCAWASPPAAVEPVAVRIGARGAARLHVLTLAWAGGLVLVYGVLALTVGMPRTAESGVMGNGLEVPLQWAALGLVVVGVLAARRWHVAGAVVAALASGVLGYASGVEYPPPVALVVVAATFVPALLLWLEWHRRTSLRAALAVAAATAVLLGTVVGGGAATYSSYWGPTHPGSSTPAPGTDVVEWMWAGGTTATGTEVRLRLDDPAGRVRLVVSRSPDLSDPEARVGVRVDADLVGAARVRGLEPGTRYHYAAEVDGALDRSRVQSLRTFPRGPSSFSFVVGSCLRGGSNGRVFDQMRSGDPLFALFTGDWGYPNIDVDDPSRYLEAYQLNLAAPAQAALYGSTSVAYVWDDHDYGGNDADRTSPSRPAAMGSYRQLVPHYVLPSGPQGPVNQAFTVGRVRFVVTDTRSARDPAGGTEQPYRSTLGAAQRTWLLDELSRADRYALVVWVTPDPWVDPEREGGDGWGGFPEERREIADALVGDGVDNLLVLSGDAHMLAVDDGTHTDYSTAGGTGFPLFQAAAIDRPGTVKGGPYSGPVLPGGGQFGEVAIDDDGGTVTVTLTGRRWDGEQLLTHVLTYDGGDP